MTHPDTTVTTISERAHSHSDSSRDWLSIGDLLAAAAHRHADDEFLRFPHHACSLTFRDIEELTREAAGVLVARGVSGGDRVAIMLPNVPAWPITFLAALRIGAVSVPINPQFRTADIAHVLRDSGAKIVVTSVESEAVVASAIRGADLNTEVLVTAPLPAPGDGSPVVDDFGTSDRAGLDSLASLQYTSGTTGLPKACMLTHDYWLRLADSIVDAVDVGGDDVALMVQPWSYMDQQWMSIVCLMTGRPLVVLPKFSASGFWEAVRREKATITYVLGTMPRLLAKQPDSADDRNHAMRLILCSGIPKEAHADLERRWGVPWRETYGSSESGCDLIALPDDTDTVGTGAMGRPPPGKTVDVRDQAGHVTPVGQIGEIVVSGRGLMLGYWNAPEATERVLDTSTGSYRTGDRGFRDEHGYIHHAGRLKEMIRRGGENISAAEVEAALATHPAVLNVAVVGIPDEIFGELVKAVVILRPEAPGGERSGKDLADYASTQLARFKLPEYYEFVGQLPMTPSQRVEKKKLLLPGKDQRADVYDVRLGAWVTSHAPIGN